MSAIATIETFLEITICETAEKVKNENCQQCPVLDELKDLLSKTKKEKLLTFKKRL